MRNKTIFFILFFQHCQLLLPTDQSNFHEQLNVALLKNVTVENPSEKEQTLINVAKAFHNFGTPITLSQPENWHALQSVDFFSILAKYNHAQTVSGCRMLQQQCSVGMTDDIAILQSRQNRIQFLHQHFALREKLSAILHRSIHAEQKFLNLFKDLDPSARNLYFSSEWFAKLNEDSTAMEISARIESTIPLIMSILLFIYIPITINLKQDNTDSIFFSKLSNAVYKALINITQAPKYAIDDLTPRTGYTTAVALTTAYYAHTAYTDYMLFKHSKELFDIIYEKQQDLIAISHLIKSLKMMQKTFEQHEQLKEIMPTEYAKLTELFDQNNTQPSCDLKKLISNLLSTSFKGTGSYFYSQQGKILATHHALVRIKGELIPYLEAFGQIDAYLATVKLYDQFKDHPNAQFCLPEYINNDAPIFITNNFWHPLLNPETVVCNELNMGHQNSHANLIITGPNAGGKTTALMALIINIIFAQSLGIAPSKFLCLTPFTKIHSSLDITTNLKEGLSLFAAEVDRAKKLKNSIISCSSKQKSFTIIDELFTGTAESVASDIGFQFATMLGNIKNSMMIITTHIKNLTKLEEKTEYFTNYKVADAFINEKGIISYPFKLVQGISDQNIAVEMMQQEGIL